MQGKEILKLLEKIQELIELSNNNCYNLCLMGGMVTLLEIIVAYDGDEVRRSSCRVFNSVTNNNEKVQNFARRLGAINLCIQLEREQTPEMRELILGCLSSYLKAQNFPSKRKYIVQMNGLEQLSKWLCIQSAEE